MNPNKSVSLLRRAAPRSGFITRQAPTRTTVPERFGVIYNPKATNNVGKAPLRAIDAPCAVPTTKLELVEALRDFRRREVGTIAVSGGDGTVRDVLTAIPEAYGDEDPRVAILPSGRTDLIAGDIGAVRRDDELARLLAAAKDGTLNEVKRPVVRVNRVVDQDGEVRSVRGILMGAAGFVYATQVAQGDVHATGASHMRAVTMTVFEMLRRLATQPNPGGLKLGFPIHVSLDGRADIAGENGHRPFFLATGLRTPFCLGRTPFEGLSQDPELLHIFDVHGPTSGIGRAFGSLLINRPWLAGPKWNMDVARNVTLEGIEQIVVDGEVFDTLPGDVLKVRADGPMTFVTPGA